VKESFLNPVFIICRRIENVMADSALSTFATCIVMLTSHLNDITSFYSIKTGRCQPSTWLNSRAFASGSRVNMAGLPDRLSVYGIPEEHNTIRHCIPSTSYKANCQNHSLGAGGLSLRMYVQKSNFIWHANANIYTNMKIYEHML